MKVRIVVNDSKSNIENIDKNNRVWWKKKKKREIINWGVK